MNQGTEAAVLDLLVTRNYGPFLSFKHILSVRFIQFDYPAHLIGCDSDHSLVFGQLAS
jgi:hypothetical protein